MSLPASDSSSEDDDDDDDDEERSSSPLGGVLDFGRFCATFVCCTDETESSEDESSDEDDSDEDDATRRFRFLFLFLATGRVAAAAHGAIVDGVFEAGVFAVRMMISQQR